VLYLRSNKRELEGIESRNESRKKHGRRFFDEFGWDHFLCLKMSLFDYPDKITRIQQSEFTK